MNCFKRYLQTLGPPTTRKEATSSILLDGRLVLVTYIMRTSATVTQELHTSICLDESGEGKWSRIKQLSTIMHSFQPATYHMAVADHLSASQILPYVAFEHDNVIVYASA